MSENEIIMKLTEDNKNQQLIIDELKDKIRLIIAEYELKIDLLKREIKIYKV